MFAVIVTNLMTEIEAVIGTGMKQTWIFPILKLSISAACLGFVEELRIMIGMHNINETIVIVINIRGSLTVLQNRRLCVTSCLLTHRL